MNALVNFFVQHPYIASSITTWLSTIGISAFVSSLPSPTARSTQFYIFCFKFANAALAGNFARASSPRIENSPNFQDAVNIQNAKTGTEKVVVEMPVEAPKP